MELLGFLIFSLIGFLLFFVLTHPKSSINKHLPTIKIKIIQISPTIKISLGKKTFHIHHWLLFSIILIISVTFNSELFSSLNSRGFMLGGIFQGISYPDWKRIIYRKD